MDQSLNHLRPLFQGKDGEPTFHENWTWEENKGGKNVPRKMKIMRWLGNGTYARVGVIKRDDIIKGQKLEFAAKVTRKWRNPDGTIRIDEENQRAKKFTFNEIRVLAVAGLAHRNVIKCYGAFENDNSWVTVLEYAKGGDLFSRLRELRRAGRFSETIAANYIRCRPLKTAIDLYLHSVRIQRQMVEALVYLHSKKIMHRDLKPENFLIKEKCGTFTEDVLLLSDFGLKGRHMVTWAFTYDVFTGTEVDRAVPPHGLPPSTDQKLLQITVAKAITNEQIEKYVIAGNRMQHISEIEIILGHKWFQNCDNALWNNDTLDRWKSSLIYARNEAQKILDKKQAEESNVTKSTDSTHQRVEKQSKHFSAIRRTIAKAKETIKVKTSKRKGKK
ncbi:kinase-like protein [Fomitiporia mediterranea MF3/22]|uniref:kinase-like protein n=1 Tax=Fomitiporia mediterranea (strain MF3/22) TaxID=694068 RepID=UPI0004409B48|nr:kinase-like protein [Fomitiporia mediterranea MF3/22]EJD04670.1 kinase-like protein [Fomitiporia mediterranea MF3/22]